MMKRLFALFFLLLTLTIYCQSKIESLSFDAKKINSTLDIDSGFFLLENTTINISEFCLKSNIRHIRTLAEGTYIISINPLSKINTSDVNLYSIDNSWKLSQELSNSSLKKRGYHTLTIQTTDTELFVKEWNIISPESKVLYKSGQNITLQIPHSDFDLLIDNTYTTAISRYNIPKAEADVLNHDLTVNTVNTVNETYPDLNGAPIIVSIKEQLFNVEDIDFRDRYFLTGIENEDLAQHASTVGTIIAGAGNSSLRGRGVANAATITSSDFLQILPDDDVVFTSNNISVQNHSYGTIIESEYGIEAAAYDASTNTNNDIVHVFSSGNRGDNTPENGTYAGIPNFSNQTGNFKAAKNVITVGAINRFDEIDPRSSRGPAYDGRVKPELVAYAPGGTSDAAALVSGVSTLLQDSYLTSNGQLPPSSLVKAALITGAEDVGSEGIDFQSGYGNLNAKESVDIINNNQYRIDEISSNASRAYTITIPPNTQLIKVALTWNDPAANPGDLTALVNDLDLTLLDPNNNTFLPWVLDSTPNVDALNAPAQRLEDHLNNVELISIDNPIAGDYTISITSENLSTTNQQFSIAYNFIISDVFEWTFPTSQSPLLNDSENVIRWNSTKNENNGILEINYNNEGWSTISANTTLSDGFFTFNPENFSGTAQLRMTINGQIYLSDVFAVSPELFPSVLFNCDDEFLLDWEPVPNASGYRVNFLGDRYLELSQTVTESSVLLNKADFENSYFSIQPIFDTINGYPGVAFDFEQQGVNCYYINFLAFINQVDVVNTTLNLSTDLNVNSVRFERSLPDGSIIDIQTFTAPFNNLELISQDLNPANTTNSYRARITLNDGTEIVTETIDITLPDENTLTVFPNPVFQGEELIILSNGDNQPFEIVDISGRVVISGNLPFTNSGVIIDFSPGIYILRTLQNDRTRISRKFIVN